MEELYKDIRNNNIVKIIKKINSTAVMVFRLRDRTRYITDFSNLKRVDFKQ